MASEILGSLRTVSLKHLTISVDIRITSHYATLCNKTIADGINIDNSTKQIKGMIFINNMLVFVKQSYNTILMQCSQSTTNKSAFPFDKQVNLIYELSGLSAALVYYYNQYNCAYVLHNNVHIL